MTTRERVERGAALLTKHFGGLGWVTRIDLETLDISNPERCVLGQVFARPSADDSWDTGYARGHTALFGPGRVEWIGGVAAEHGFTDEDIHDHRETAEGWRAFLRAGR